MIDYKLTHDGDLAIENGDFPLVDATENHQQHIMIAEKGEYKQYPEIGVGINSFINDENPRKILTDIKRNFKYDGMNVKKVTFTPNGNISVDASY